MAKSNTVKLEMHTRQLLPGPEWSSYGRAWVGMHEPLDGTVVLACQVKSKPDI